jgi:hypothetical protein
MMNISENQRSDAPRQGVTVNAKSFGWGLRTALILPVLAALSAWLIQWFLRLPQGSFGASLTASVLVLAPLAEIVPVPVAITKLVRHASLRTITAVTLTAVGAALLLLGVLLVLVLFLL